MSTTKYIKKFIWKEPKKKNKNANDKKSTTNKLPFIDYPSSELVYSIFKNEHEETLKSINIISKKCEIYSIINVILLILSSFLFTFNYLNFTNSSWIKIALLCIMIIFVLFTYFSIIYSTFKYKKVMNSCISKTISIESFSLKDMEKEEDEIYEQLINNYKNIALYNNALKNNLTKELQSIIYSTICSSFSICIFVILTIIFKCIH